MLYSKIEGSGKPLLILHGFLGMSDNWKTLGVQFASEGFEVHILDLRNHGRSFQSEEFSYELMVQDIGPKYYAPHHQDILAGLMRLIFLKNQVEMRWKLHFRTTFLILGLANFCLKIYIGKSQCN